MGLWALNPHHGHHQGPAGSAEPSWAREPLPLCAEAFLPSCLVGARQKIWKDGYVLKKEEQDLGREMTNRPCKSFCKI